MPGNNPNIVFIMCDQLTSIALKTYGNTVCQTPNIDALAEHSVLFENNYCNYPLCSPSRFAMMTGRLPSRVGAYDNGSEFPAAVPTMAHYLRDAGYYTCIAGKMHFIGPDQMHGFEDRLTTEIYPAHFGWTPNKGYDDLEADQGTGDQEPHLGVSSVETVADAGPVARSMQLDYDDEVGNRACQHLFDYARSDEARPLFMMVSFTQPHDPYVVSREYWNRYSTDEIDLPMVDPIPVADLDPHTVGLRKHYQIDRFEITEDIYRRARQGYYGMVSYIDDQVGRLVQTLKDAGMWDNTVLVFSSDHGDMIGERGLWFKKTLFDPAVRVPLIIRIPGQSGRRITTPTSLIDLLPTLNDLAGLSESDLVTEIEGKNLLPLLAQEDTERLVCCEHLEGAVAAPRVMIRQGRWKIVVSEAYPDQLYDLENDPVEMINLAEDPAYATVKKEMKNSAAGIWDLPKLRKDVMQNQKMRSMIFRALNKGKTRDWDEEPNAPAMMRFVRNDDVIHKLERARYLPYSD